MNAKTPDALINAATEATAKNEGKYDGKTAIVAGVGGSNKTAVAAVVASIAAGMFNPEFAGVGLLATTAAVGTNHKIGFSWRPKNGPTIG